MDTLTVPEWLNTELFTKVLHTCEKDESIRVKNFKITPATLKGDNFASIMLRANVEYDNSREQGLSISMIIKTDLVRDNLKKNVTSKVFETETAIYTEVLPRFHDLLRQAGDKTVLGPKCLYHSFTPHNLIILEDVVPLGFSMVRDRALNLEEIKLAYLKLAKWHALSYKISKEIPTIFDRFSDNFMKLVLAGINDFMTCGMEVFIEMLETQPSLRQYKPYFEAMQPDLIEKCIAACSEYNVQPQKDTHYVLCHGDFHNKNLMFKWNAENQVEDLMLVDFQLSYMGSMDLEIIYSMIMLLSKEQRTDHMDELINHYFSNFVDTLKQVGYEGEMPKVVEFQQMMRRHECFHILLMVTFLPFWHASKSKKLDVTALLGPKEYRKSWYYDEEYIAEMEECLPKFFKMGLLDN